MKTDSSKICFGLTEELDQDSLVSFLALAGREKFAETFAKRLSSSEIIELTDHFMKLLRRHLSEQEYHELFLNDKTASHDHKQ